MENLKLLYPTNANLLTINKYILNPKNYNLYATI